MSHPVVMPHYVTIDSRLFVSVTYFGLTKVGSLPILLSLMNLLVILTMFSSFLNSLFLYFLYLLQNKNVQQHLLKALHHFTTNHYYYIKNIIYYAEKERIAIKY